VSVSRASHFLVCIKVMLDFAYVPVTAAKATCLSRCIAAGCALSDKYEPMGFHGHFISCYVYTLQTVCKEQPKTMHYAMIKTGASRPCAPAQLMPQKPSLRLRRHVHVNRLVRAG
jgi:hypothetical protein